MPVAPPEERAVIDLIREAVAAGRTEEALRLAEERLEMGRRRLRVKKSSATPFTSSLTPAILLVMETKKNVGGALAPRKALDPKLSPPPDRLACRKESFSGVTG